MFLTIAEQFRNGTFADRDTPLGALLYGIVFAIAAWLFGRMLHLAVHRLLARDTRALVDRTTINFLAQLARIGVYIFAFISYAHLIPALSKLGTAWLASVSVISVIMGLAAQNTLGNLIAGVSLVLYRPFKLGDRMQISAPTGVESGVVETLGLGYTVLKTDDNRRIVVPNSIMASQTTVNLAGEDPRAQCLIPFGIDVGADVDKARAVVLELARQHAKVKEVAGCAVTQVSAAGVVLTLTVWCVDLPAAGEVKCDLLEQAHKRFQQAGINAAVPRSAVTVTQTPHAG